MKLTFKMALWALVIFGIVSCGKDNDVPSNGVANTNAFTNNFTAGGACSQQATLFYAQCVSGAGTIGLNNNCQALASSVWPEMSQRGCCTVGTAGTTFSGGFGQTLSSWQVSQFIPNTGMGFIQNNGYSNGFASQCQNTGLGYGGVNQTYLPSGNNTYIINNQRYGWGQPFRYYGSGYMRHFHNYRFGAWYPASRFHPGGFFCGSRNYRGHRHGHHHGGHRHAHYGMYARYFHASFHSCVRY